MRLSNLTVTYSTTLSLPIALRQKRVTRVYQASQSGIFEGAGRGRGSGCNKPFTLSLSSVHVRGSPAANNFLQQQEKFDRFIECYNQERRAIASSAPTVRSLLRCYPCHRYKTLPMCPERTLKELVEREGIEPSTPAL